MNSHSAKEIKRIRENAQTDLQRTLYRVQYCTNMLQSLNTVGSTEIFEDDRYLSELQKAAQNVRTIISSCNQNVQATLDQEKAFEEARREAEELRQASQEVEKGDDVFKYDKFESTAERIIEALHYDYPSLFERTQTYVDELALELLESKNIILDKGEGYSRSTIISLGPITLSIVAHVPIYAQNGEVEYMVQRMGMDAPTVRTYII